MAKKKTKKRTDSAGERTVYHLRIPDAMRDGVRAQAKSRGVTMNEIQDEACTWFLKNKAKRSYMHYIAPHRAGEYRTLWIDSRLSERLRTVAERDYVPVARVIYTALALYLEDRD